MQFSVSREFSGYEMMIEQNLAQFNVFYCLMVVLQYMGKICIANAFVGFYSI